MTFLNEARDRGVGLASSVGVVVLLVACEFRHGLHIGFGGADIVSSPSHHGSQEAVALAQFLESSRQLKLALVAEIPFDVILKDLEYGGLGGAEEECSLEQLLPVEEYA